VGTKSADIFSLINQLATYLGLMSQLLKSWDIYECIL